MRYTPRYTCINTIHTNTLHTFGIIHITYIYILPTHTSTNVSSRTRRIFVYLPRVLEEDTRVHFFGTSRGMARETFFTRVFVLTWQRGIFLRESEQVPISSRQVSAIRIFIDPNLIRFSKLFKYSLDEITRNLKFADLSIDSSSNRWFFSRQGNDRHSDVPPISTREWSDIRAIYASGQSSKQIIQLIDYSDVSSGSDSIQAPDESGTTTGNNWLAK